MRSRITKISAAIKTRSGVAWRDNKKVSSRGAVFLLRADYCNKSRLKLTPPSPKESFSPETRLLILAALAHNDDDGHIMQEAKTDSGHGLAGEESAWKITHGTRALWKGGSEWMDGWGERSTRCTWHIYTHGSKHTYDAWMGQPKATSA